MNLRAGTTITVDRPVWANDIDAHERTPINATWHREGWEILGCEWLPPH